VDGGVLPGSASGPAQPTDVEAVDLNQISWLVDIEVQRLRRHQRLSFWLGRVAGDQAQALDPGAQAMAAKALEHAARCDHEASPHRQAELGCDTTRAQARMAEGKADDSFLSPGRQL